ncbi:hypothetical protein MFLAVUS_006991 [Mucor flavus]|uniref:Uncharacterized protein n=1 Tax=Mucor flavus TaxID=439312 RepID=A0ABP9Z330_9FUNG
MDSQRLFKHLVETLSTMFGEVKQLENVLQERDEKTRGTITVCHNLYSTFYDHMCGISVEYDIMFRKLGTIEQDLISIQGLEVRNTSVLSGIKSTVGGLMETLGNYKERIESVQRKVVTAKEETNSEILSLENESFGINVFQKIFKNIAEGVAIGALAMGAAEEIVASEILASTVGAIGSPIHIICIAGIYTAISQLYIYLQKTKKRKSLINALNKVVVLLDSLLHEADNFTISHTKTIKDLEHYLSSVDMTINRFNEEGPLNISGLTSFMLQKTGKIQTSFELMKTQAESNAESLRRSLLDINPRSIINQ